MVKVRQEVTVASKGVNTFMGRFNVNTCIPVNRYDAIKKYNAIYLEQLKAINGDNVSIPDSMRYRNVSRGDILVFGDEIVVDEETGHISVFPKEVFNEMAKYKVELPCVLFGPVQTTYEKIKTLASPKMKKAIENLKEDTARFRVVPYVEKYTEDMEDLED